MGGGNGTPEIYEKWKTLGGGTNAHVVLIPTANNSERVKDVLAAGRSLNARNLSFTIFGERAARV